MPRPRQFFARRECQTAGKSHEAEVTASRVSGAVVWALVECQVSAIKERQLAVWLSAGHHKILWRKPHPRLQVRNAPFSGPW